MVNSEIGFKIIINHTIKNKKSKIVRNKYHTGKAGGFITALKGHFTSIPLKRCNRS